jgi:hypothetical protein
MASDAQSESTRDGQGLPSDTTSVPPHKPAFTPPKLTYLAPTLTVQGSLIEVTKGFFGAFSP